MVNELAHVFLSQLLQSVLAAIVHYFLLVADHPPDPYYHRVLAKFLVVLGEINEAGGVGEVGQHHFLVMAAPYFHTGGKLLIEHDAPLDVSHHFPQFSNIIDINEFLKYDGFFFRLVIVPKHGLVPLAESD